MPQALFEILSPSATFDKLPLDIRQETSAVTALMKMLLLVPLLAAIVVPLGLVAANAASHPAIMSALIAKPLASLQVLAGLALWTFVFAVPFKSLLGRLGRERLIRINAGKVQVTERHLFRRKSWSLPISAFSGIAHNLRTTVSGTHHELILVHPDKRHSLLLLTGDVISEGMIQDACRLLALPQLPARDLYFKLGRAQSGARPELCPAT